MFCLVVTIILKLLPWTGLNGTTIEECQAGQIESGMRYIEQGMKCI